MLIHDKDLGRIKLLDIPVPDDAYDFFGTYTYSGRVLVSYHSVNDSQKEDWYNIITINDDGSGLRNIYSGAIPKISGANGIRWMCFADNKRILLGDYILECSPDLDNCTRSELIPLKYPDEFNTASSIFCRWSEIIIAPDNQHMAWTTLTMNGAVNYLAKLVRNEKDYSLKGACIISSTEVAIPDKDNEGYSILQPVRGGEVKQFIWGGKALTMVGNGDSITESVVQPLESNDIIQITETPGYEETTIFSPDEKFGVVMSPRFSYKTSCAIFGLIPQPHSMVTRSRMINILYMYCVAGVRAFRNGNIGPVLIDIECSKTEKRNYMGVNLSDPECKWVYYSPISWHPDSSKAMWNERTRMTQGPTKCRLRMCHMLDYKSKGAVPASVTPDMEKIPYAKPFSISKDQNMDGLFPLMIKGKKSGRVVNSMEAKEQPVYISKYENFSDDGKSIYNGYISIITQPSMFSAGKTIFEADFSVKGEHNGEMKLRAVFNRDGVHAPAMLSFAKGEDGLPESKGYSTYDGITLKIEDMEN